MNAAGTFSTSYFQGGEKVETGGDPTPSTTTSSGVWGGGGEIPTPLVEVEKSEARPPLTLDLHALAHDARAEASLIAICGRRAAP